MWAGREKGEKGTGEREGKLSDCGGGIQAGIGAGLVCTRGVRADVAW